MANQILIKHTATPGKIPLTSDLALGELAVNTNDGKIFFKKNTTGVDSIITIDPSGFNTVTSVNNGIGDVSITASSINAINLNQIGISNGIAGLDSSGRVPKTQLPEIQTNLSSSIQIPAISGTTIIPYDDTTPTITEGTQIASQGYIPSDVNSKMQIVGCINIDCGTSNRNFILSFFRDSTCIGVTTKNFVSTRRPDTFPFVITDLNMGASFGSTIIYSVRVGLNTSGTWYINRMKSPVFNNMLNSNSIIFSEYL